LKAAEEAFYASHVWNPFFFQGVKTFAYEVWEQLGFNAPDTLILPVGNGTLLIGAYLGFRDLLSLGLISRVPRLIAVQAENCAPLYRRFHDRFHERKGDSESVPKETLAEGIAIAAPSRIEQMLGILHKTGGDVLAASESDIRESLAELGHNGFYIEPTSAVVWSAFKKCSTRRDETVVAALTGHGLKHGYAAEE
jgi:threonine synthase